MEWDQIAEKWGQMALRLRNDSPTGTRMLGSGSVNRLPDSIREQTPAPYAPNDGPSRTGLPERTGSDSALTPSR